MAEPDKVHPFWGFVGKLTAFGILIGMIFGAYGWWTKPTQKLQATIDRGAFYLPPRYAEFQTNVSDALSSEGLEKTLQSLEKENESSLSSKDDAISKVKLNWSAFALSRALTEKLKIDPYTSSNPYNGYWEAEIVNTGSLPVEKVMLRLPTAELAVVSREDDGTSTTDTKGPMIELGDIGASQKVKVVAWATGYASLFPDIGEAPSIHHAGGAGSVILNYQPTFMGWFSQNIGKTFIGLGVIYFGLLILFGVRSIRVERAKLSPPEKSP